MSKDTLSTRYACVCDQAYNKKSEIRKHVSSCKYAQLEDNQSVICPVEKDVSQLSEIRYENHKNFSKEQQVGRFKCGCEKRFKSKGGYYRHIKKCKFRPEQQIVTGKTKCNEPGCVLTFKYIRDFRQHLNEIHKIHFDVEDKTFKRYSDFTQWKEKYETETSSCFYHRKTETRSGRKVEYWYCNRSGIYQSASQGRRRKLKSQGILKINNNCTSSITLTLNDVKGTVQAIIHHTHYGHEAELVHLRIPKSDKQEIASKLLQGVKIDDILLSYKEDGLCKKTERKHLIKRRDILNISKKYNVNIMLPKEQPPPKIKKSDELMQVKMQPLLDKDPSLNTFETKKRHTIASQLPLSFVNQVYEDLWRISAGNISISTSSSNNYNGDFHHVSKNDATCCSNTCEVYCDCCNICYHSYSCTCTDFISKNIICEHVHLVVIFQITPQTYQYEENSERPHYGNQDHTVYTQPISEATTFTQPIGNVHQHALNDYDHSHDHDYVLPYKQKSENIKSLKARLEKLMSDSLQQINACDNCHVLESIERQMKDITCTLSADLLQNKKRVNEIQTINFPEKNIEVYYTY